MHNLCRCQVLLPVLLGMLLLSTGPADANTGWTVWATVGSACVVDEASAGKVDLSVGSIRFKGSQTGTIVARCNVTAPLDGNQDPQWDELRVSFKDPDGLGTGARAIVRFRRVSIFTGGWAGIQTFDSNNISCYPGGEPDGCDAYRVHSYFFSHVYDFFQNGYYIEIELTRTSTYVASPAVAVVGLESYP